MPELTQSQHLWERAKRVTPGGVHSPVRAFRGVGGTPVFMERGEGPSLYDVDGNSYLDFCMSWGALILGHAHPEVHDAIDEALARGWSYGTTEPYSLALAEWLTDHLPFLEQVRFVCSGTEAVMSALRLARGFTKRDKVLKFEGCYHGCADSLLVKAGSGLAEAPSPSSLGVPYSLSQDTLVVPLDDEEAFDKIFLPHATEIAAVIIEPLPANHGLLIQRKEFLAHLRRRTQEAGTLLILDEVISGFRVGMGGMTEILGITPDLVTYGKVMGGGFPMGAYGGRKDIMSLVAPLGGVYQAGTLAGNPVGCVAGLTTLQILERQRLHAQLEERAKRFETLLSPVLADKKLHFTRFGSVFWFAPASNVRTAAMVPSAVNQVYAPLFHACLKEGLYFAPSGFEVGFLSACLEETHLDEAANKFRRALATLP